MTHKTPKRTVALFGTVLALAVGCGGSDPYEKELRNIETGVGQRAFDRSELRIYADLVRVVKSEGVSAEGELRRHVGFHVRVARKYRDVLDRDAVEGRLARLKDAVGLWCSSCSAVIAAELARE